MESEGFMDTENLQIIWLTGYPCAGKTFYGDYLATLGWEMVDGDAPLYSKDPKDIATWASFTDCLLAWNACQVPPED